MIAPLALMTFNSSNILPLNELIDLRIDPSQELQCLLQQHFDEQVIVSNTAEDEYNNKSNRQDNGQVIRNQSNNDVITDSKYCETQFDSILCWPRTPTNTVAVLPCLKEFQGIKYDSTRK